VIPDGERNVENIIPGAFTPGVADAVAVAVAQAWTDRVEA